MKKILFFFFVLLNVFQHPIANAQTIASSGNHTVVICENGQVQSWGLNNRGQLGNNTTTNSLAPVTVLGIHNVTSVCVGNGYTLALKKDGTVWAWGYNSNGILGDSTTIDRYTPVQVKGLTNIKEIVAAKHYGSFNLALKTDGTVYAWGKNNYGQLGDGTTADRFIPLKVVGLDSVVSIAAGSYHALAIKKDGSLWAWGGNSDFQLGDGTSTNRLLPVKIMGIINPIIAIEGDVESSIASTADGKLWTWGTNTFKALGIGQPQSYIRQTPGTVPTLNNIIKISSYWYTYLALKSDGTVWTWGNNYGGQLGNGLIGPGTEEAEPIYMGISNGIDIACGIENNFILKNDRSLWGVGRNNYGCLGDGTTSIRKYPVQSVGICQVKLPPKVFGLIYNDISENCVREIEPGINKRKAIIQPGDIIIETTMSGYWYLDSLTAGTYSITIDTTGKWKPTCDVTQSFTVIDPDGFTEAPSFGLVSTEPCSEPNVSIHMPRMRDGFSNQKVYVQACNEYIATGALVSGYVDVSLDELITVNSASMSYTDMGDNSFRIDVGTLNPGQCVNFDMSTTVSTDAVLGQTLCLEALLYPVENCVLDTIPTPEPPDFDPCDLPWDNSSILVEAECVGDSIVFTITNTGDPGDGDMDCFSPVRLYIDGEYIWLDSIQLAGGETFTYTFAGDGRTWRLEVAQHPLHPGNSNPNATVELCGDPSNWTPDLVNILPQDDEDPIKDIYCGIVTGSYDPNDKTGYPLGVGEDHLIEPNRKMEYVIRFQNTGTDTAFTVKVLDTLDTDLDIFSVRSGVSSHNYSFRMHGPRVLEWTFYDIELPDSTTNEPASHGFVTFTAKQNKDLADGTEINNRVGIYFDYNDPIITNTTSHIIGRSIKTPPPLSTEDFSALLSMTRIYPNPNTGSFTLAFGQQLSNANINVTDVLGKTIYNTTVSGDKHNVQLNEAKGIYFVSIQTEQGERTTLKLVVE